MLICVLVDELLAYTWNYGSWKYVYPWIMKNDTCDTIHVYSKWSSLKSFNFMLMELLCFNYVPLNDLVEIGNIFNLEMWILSYEITVHAYWESSCSKLPKFMFIMLSWLYHGEIIACEHMHGHVSGLPSESHTWVLRVLF